MSLDWAFWSIVGMISAACIITLIWYLKSNISRDDLDDMGVEDPY